MAKAIVSRQDGDRFQARLFWSKAAQLLDPSSNIARVGFETGPKAYDDVFVDYEPGRGPKDQFGELIEREHLQAKWHSSHGSYGYADFVDPGFINANAVSLLERTHAACQQFGADQGVMFRLATNWTIDRNDTLQRLVATRWNAIRVDLLAQGTDRSMFGRVRKLWREHLGIDDDELKRFARMLGIGTFRESLDDLRAMLDREFTFVGMRRVPASNSTFFYDDLPFQLMAQGRTIFDRQSFHDMCQSEDLLEGRATQSYSIGVKSFIHPFDTLEDRCSRVLDLTGEFDGRFIRDDDAWAGDLYPRLVAFLLDGATTSDRLRLSLDAHLSLAFAAGSVLHIKSGRMVELEQRAPALTVWSPGDPEPEDSWPVLETEVLTIDGAKPEVAMALAITHPIQKAVTDYIARELPNVGTLLVCRIASGSGRQTVHNGRHADEIAAAAAHALHELPPAPMLHLFIAAPNALTFFLGQRQMSLGPTLLYEHDFEGTRDRSYRPSLKLPIGAPAERGGLTTI